MFPRISSAVCLMVVATVAVAGDPPLRWRTDYNAARKEAEEKGLPILLVVGSEDCFYCKKMDATTFQDSTIIPVAGKQFVPVKIDGNAEQGLCKALQVRLYPPVVLAGPSGKIHQMLTGYQSATDLNVHLQRTVNLSAAERVVKAATGESTAVARTRELLAVAREEFRAERFGTCLDHSEYLAANFADTDEGKEAASLIAQIKADPDKLQAAADQRVTRAAGIQMTLAEAYQKKGDNRAASLAFEKVIALIPESSLAVTAKAELTKLATPTIAVPAVLKK